MTGRERAAVLAFALVTFAIGALILARQTWARPPIPAQVFKAVRAYWVTRADRVKAFDVIACETGGTYSTQASNGQYLGMFQMGSSERERFGHSSTAMGQARAAHRYWLISGWSPWSCA